MAEGLVTFGIFMLLSIIAIVVEKVERKRRRERIRERWKNLGIKM